MYFRISEEEFEQIVRACEDTGARTISDLARAAVLRFITPENRRENGNVERQILGDMKALGESVGRIRSEVQVLAELLRQRTESRGDKADAARK